MYLKIHKNVKMKGNFQDPWWQIKLFFFRDEELLQHPKKNKKKS
jgi:hypothetical protein